MFVSRLTDFSHVYVGDHDGSLLALSAITATTAVWISLGVSRKLGESGIKKRWLWRFWWLAGSAILGLAVWGMHFIVALAMRLPVPYSFDPSLTAISVVPAIIAAALVLPGVRTEQIHAGFQLRQAAILGGGIGLMHYIGMSAMQLQADILYDPAWFILSLLVAVALSWVTLRIKWLVESRQALGLALILIPSILMGMSVMGIHFTAMLGTHFFPNEQASPAQFQSVMASTTLAWLIAASVLGLAGLLALSIHLSHRLELANLVEKSADFNRSLLDTANDGIITTNAAGTIRSMNATAERMFGIRAKNAIGQSVMILLPEAIREQRDYFMSDDGLNLPRLVNRTLELKSTRADGHPIDVELTITPLQRGGHLQLVGVVRDISRRKGAERELRAQKDHLEFLLAASPIIIYTRKAVGSLPFTFVSPNVQELLGLLVDDIKDSAAFWSERIHPDDCERVQEARAQLRESGSCYLEYRIRYPNGDYRWISDRQIMTRDRKGKPDLIIGNWAEVHERKQAEKQLEANEQRMRISMECAQLATWDWIIATGEVAWSDNMKDKLGLAAEAPADYESFMNCVHPEDRQKVKAAFRSSLVKGVRFDEEYRVVWPDRTVHWLHSIGGLINDQQGNPQQMVGVLYETTEKKKLRLAPDAIQESA